MEENVGTLTFCSKRKERDHIELPLDRIQAKEKVEKRDKFYAKRKNISQILNSTQLYMRNTVTGQSEIIYNVRYTERKKDFLITGRRCFGKYFKLAIRYDEFEYDRNGRSILTYNVNRIRGFFFSFRKVFKKTPYMLKDCQSIVEVESIYGKDAATPLKIRTIAKSHYEVPKFREGIIIPYNHNIILQDESNAENYVANVILISYLMSDVYSLHFISPEGRVYYSRVIRAAEEGILVINDNDTYSMKVVSLSE